MKYETKQKLDAIVFYGMLVFSFGAMLTLMLYGHKLANSLLGI